MLAIKSWLETTGMKVAEERFLRPPVLPYIVFLESRTVGGADNKNCIAERTITIELYSDRINYEKEELIENLLNEKEMEFIKSRVWIDTEKCFQTLYDFNFIEKI